ncbi:dipeptidase [Sedimentibacter sp. zth1]|uniref:dipeptidase n=1 Tax=Sedimentibacter sp. zth1 TaxID=2816908 RepID=UPI001A92C31E|nr:dipeptidase [Sedimentibacter sp. zth1]QSX05528.1 dipeptidase [Sedimentibacter sp. zth1]
MNFIDFHIDTLMKYYKDKVEGKLDKEDLYKNNYHIDIERLIKSNYLAQFFATFIYMDKSVKTEENSYLNAFKDEFSSNKDCEVDYYKIAMNAFDLFYQELDKNKDKVAFAGNYNDYINNKNKNLLSAFLTVEEGGIIENKIERLDEMFKKGVRAITLTWNFENCLGFPNHQLKYQNKGLKPFGIETIERMNDLGIIVDVSHLSDGGFYDVCKYSKRPFMATHSNARSIQGHPRNLTDEMIKMLANNGGITGLNFCGAFLQNDEISTLDAMMKHIRHIINVGGLDILGLGTDFDGIGGELEVKGAQDMHTLPETMEHYKFTSKEIEAVCYKNAENFFKRYWQ